MFDISQCAVVYVVIMVAAELDVSFCDCDMVCGSDTAILKNTCFYLHIKYITWLTVDQITKIVVAFILSLSCISLSIIKIFRPVIIGAHIQLKQRGYALTGCIYIIPDQIAQLVWPI